MKIKLCSYCEYSLNYIFVIEDYKVRATIEWDTANIFMSFTYKIFTVWGEDSKTFTCSNPLARELLVNKIIAEIKRVSDDNRLLSHYDIELLVEDLENQKER